MKIKNLLFIAGAAILLSSCSNNISSDVKLKSEMDTLSYALGNSVATSLKTQILTAEDLNYDAIINGMKDILENKEVKMNEEEVVLFLRKYFSEQRALKLKVNLDEGKAFLAENKNKEGVITTPSGLQYEILTEGTGNTPLVTDTVICHYHGTLLDGTVFDSSVEKGEPFKTPLNRIIPGWVEGLQLMKEGAKYKFYIPTELGYGQRVRPGGIIEANMALIFEIELLEVIKGE